MNTNDRFSRLIIISSVIISIYSLLIFLLMASTWIFPDSNQSNYCLEICWSLILLTFGGLGTDVTSGVLAIIQILLISILAYKFFKIKRKIYLYLLIMMVVLLILPVLGITLPTVFAMLFDPNF